MKTFDESKKDATRAINTWHAKKRTLKGDDLVALKYKTMHMIKTAREMAAREARALIEQTEHLSDQLLSIGME